MRKERDRRRKKENVNERVERGSWNFEKIER
jgi:hypothetical protein